MSRPLLVVVLLLALVAAAVGALVVLTTGEPSPEPAPGATGTTSGTAGPSAAEGPTGDDASKRAKPAERSDPAQDVRAVAGVVRSAKGEPVAGAVVECYRVAEDEPDDEVRIAKSVLGDLLSEADLARIVNQRGGARRIRASVRAGMTGRSATATASSERSSGSSSSGAAGASAAEDPAEAMRIGMEIGGKLMSDPSALTKLQKVIQMASTGIEDDGKFPLAGRATTDAKGAFRLDGLDPGRVELRVTAPRFQREKERAKVGDVALEIAMEPAGRLVGEVRSEGRPLPGATVKVRTRTLVAGMDGRFSHDGARPPKEPVIASAPGHVGAGAWANVATEGDPEVVVLDLEPAATIRGRVTTRAGEPVAGASIDVARNVGGLMTMFLPQPAGSDALPGPAPSAKSGPDGTFVLEGVRAGTLDLGCEKEGYLAARVERVKAVARETTDGIDFVLVRESALEGRVTDASGAPVEGATVRVSIPAEGLMKQAATLFGGVFASGRTGADGRYRVGGATEGRRDVVVEAPGFLTQRSEETFPAEQTLVRDYAMQPGAELSGIVLLPDGGPCPGATVRVQSAGAPPANPMVAMMGVGGATAAFVTDVEGRWKASGLQHGPHTVTASAPRYLDGTARDVADGATEVTLTLGAGVTLRGRVVAAETGAGVGGATVFRKGRTSGPGAAPWMQGLAGDPSIVAGPDGSFEISGLLPGPWELYARAKGYAESGRLKVSGAAGETVSDLSLALAPGSSLSGRVLRKGAGTPIEGALVYVPLGKGPMASMNASDLTEGEPSAPADSESAKTGPDGSFVIAGLTPGKVTLEARAQGLAPTTMSGTEVPGGPVVVEMSEGGAVEGVVYAEDGRVHEGVTVMSQRGMMGQGARMSTTDREGRYRIERLAPGAYQVMVLDPESPMMVGGVASVTIRDGEVTKHDFGKPGAGRTVSGEVLRDGKPFPGATLVLLGGGSGMRLAEADAAGRFRFQGVTPGDYSVAVQSETFGGGNTSVRVSVGADEDPAAVRLEVSSLAVEGTVADAETGNPVPMAQVLLLAPGSGRGGSIQDLVARQKGQTFSDANGRFRIGDVPSGTFSLRVSAAGYAEATVDGVVPGAAPSRVTMSRGVELAVTVLGPDGMPVANASVVPVDATGEEGNPFDLSMSKITGGDGVARLRLSPGRWSIQVRAASFPEVEVAAEASQGALTVRLEAGGVLDVTVLGAGGAPLAGASVRLLDASGAEIRPSLHLGNLFGGGATTDASGRLTRDGLRPGRVTVVAKTPSGREARAEATVAAGAVTKVEVAAE